MAEIRICVVCQRVILGEAEATPRYSDSGAGPNIYRHPKGSSDCMPGGAMLGMKYRRQSGSWVWRRGGR